MTLTNDDRPSVSIASLRVAEGDAGSSDATLTVTLSAAALAPVTVNYASSDGSAGVGSDYSAIAGTLTFAPGETSKTLSVAIAGDSAIESDETFTVALSSPSGNATLGTASAATVTIANDDLPSLGLAGDVTVLEGDSGAANAVFTVNLSAAAAGAVTVQYATSDGSATAGSDYSAASDTLSFAAGETSKTISLPVRGDTLLESPETVLLTLSSPSGATLGAVGSATLTINDNDQMGDFSTAPDNRTYDYELSLTPGDDSMQGSAGPDKLLGLAGNDTLSGNEGDDRVDGGEGNDVLSGEVGNDLVLGGLGTDTLHGNAGDDSLDGGDGNDNLNGEEGNDRLQGGVGADTVSGSTGNDSMDGGEGDDVLSDGRGVDLLIGGVGNDNLSADSGWLGAGNDSLQGGEGDDTLRNGYLLDGGAGNDVISNDLYDEYDDYGGYGSFLLGGDGDDTISGYLNYDLVRRNYVSGGNGNDSITMEDACLVYGDAGNDILIGSVYAADTLIGGSGADTLTGAGAADIFRYTAATDAGVGAGNRDLITDFSASGGDVIDLKPIDPAATWSFVRTGAFTGAGHEIRFQLDSANSATLVSVDLNGDNAAELEIQLTGIVLLSADDFGL